MLVEAQEAPGNLVLRSTLKKESMSQRCMAGRRFLLIFLLLFFFFFYIRIGKCDFVVVVVCLF